MPICKQCGAQVDYLVLFNGKNVCPGCADKNARAVSDRNARIIALLKAHPLQNLTDIRTQLEKQGLSIPSTTLYDALNDMKEIKRSGTLYFVEA